MESYILNQNYADKSAISKRSAYEKLYITYVSKG